MRIKLENLKKTYISEKSDKTKERVSITAVNGISLDIPENKIFGIIGKSGAGKSSLVRLISLLETPDEGAVYYDDARVDNLGKKELIAQRRKIGMIFQNFNLFTSRTAGKNIAYPLEICGTPKAEISARVKEMLKLVGLEDREDAPISTLSGGQKQRIAIARALATKPDILFCDEATSALDPQTTRSILNLIRDIQKKMNLTVVMITHQMEVVRDACELVAVVEGGKIVESGTVKEIFSNPKTSTTREFIKNINPNSDVADSFVQWSESHGNYYLLSFSEKSTNCPILSQVAKKFDVEFNVQAAGVEKLSDEKMGLMYIEISGEQSEIDKAIAFFEENGVKVTKKNAEEK